MSDNCVRCGIERRGNNGKLYCDICASETPSQTEKRLKEIWAGLLETECNNCARSFKDNHILCCVRKHGMAVPSGGWCNEYKKQ